MSDWSEDGYYDTCFAVERSRRYHAKMQAFYDGCYNLTRVATALTGTASFFSLISGGAGTTIAKWLTGIVAAAATFDQVFRFNRKARAHEALARRFTELSSKLAGWEPVPQNLKRARTERLRIERDEPPVKRLIDLLAQNEEVRARGISKDHCVPLSRLQRTFGYVWTFDMLRLERWEAERGQQMEELKIPQ
ncbi:MULTISPECIES: hypothetical protein [unclassified Bradyrhizobium]|uniref:hypothetical protein n=1 Tax=unclassified Bradyrhizobium TaxID=2631580 RepID=UPI002915E5EE|nr:MULTISPECIES: hypothetical protein [unclassified Bradyrhizobium]